MCNIDSTRHFTHIVQRHLRTIVHVSRDWVSSLQLKATQNENGKK